MHCRVEQESGIAKREVIPDGFGILELCIVLLKEMICQAGNRNQTLQDCIHVAEQIVVLESHHRLNSLI